MLISRITTRFFHQKVPTSAQLTVSLHSSWSSFHILQLSSSSEPLQVAPCTLPSFSVAFNFIKDAAICQLFTAAINKRDEKEMIKLLDIKQHFVIWGEEAWTLSQGRKQGSRTLISFAHKIRKQKAVREHSGDKNGLAFCLLFGQQLQKVGDD